MDTTSRSGAAISSKTIAVFVVVVIVVVAGLGVVSSGVLHPASPSRSSISSSLSGSTARSNSSSTSATSSSSGSLNYTVETSNSTLGLELVLSVNSTTIPSEEAIGVSGSLLNTRSTTINLTASDDWPVHGLLTSPCPEVPAPAGIAFFRGHYGLNNVSSAKAIDVWPSITCPASDVLNVTSYSFPPESHVVNYSGYFGSYANPRKGTSSTLTTYGASVYAANGTGFFYSLDSALPSAYTVAAGDEWGQLVLLHFEVTASNNLPRVGNFLSYEGGCSPGPCITSRFSGALVFNCAAAAATPSGCSEIYDEGVRFSAAPPVNYTVTVWYPSYAQPNEPASANCMYTVWPVGALGKPTAPPSFGYCLMINSTAFVVSLPEP